MVGLFQHNNDAKLFMGEKTVNKSTIFARYNGGIILFFPSNL